MKYLLFILLLLPVIGNSQMIINSYAFGGGGGDVTPDPVDWPDVTFTIIGETESQTISGITSSITISIGCEYCGDGGVLYYSLNGGSFVQYTAPFSVSNGQTLTWSVEDLPFSGSHIINVINDSDGGAILDAITFFRSDPN
jgi:hypothetical protein